MDRPGQRGGARRSRSRSDAKPVGELLGALLSGTKQGRVVAREMLVEAWTRVVGPEVAAATRVDGYQNGVLRVEVESAALLQELATFRRTELLSSLRADKGMVVHDIRDVRFRVGAFDSQ
ncbi:DciA family protein [Planctomycetota bacterium]